MKDAIHIKNEQEIKEYKQKHCNLKSEEWTRWKILHYHFHSFFNQIGCIVYASYWDRALGILIPHLITSLLGLTSNFINGSIIGFLFLIVRYIYKWYQISCCCVIRPCETYVNFIHFLNFVVGLALCLSKRV